VGSIPARHLADQTLSGPASYMTLSRGDRVFDLFGWLAGEVVDARVTDDEQFDGVVVESRGKRLFVDAPEVGAIYDGLVQIALTNADLARAAAARRTPRSWPRGPRQAPPRVAGDPASHDDAVALVAALTRVYVEHEDFTLADFEEAVGRVLSARTCGDLDSVAEGLLARLSPDEAGSAG
jgi:hypothetical protein